MSKILTAKTQSAITNKKINPVHTILINSIDVSAYLISSNVSYSKEFGSASASFVLNNADGRFNDSGANALEVGQIVSYSCSFEGDTVSYNKFYGTVQQRAYEKSANSRFVTITCLDYISTLQFLDIDAEYEGTKEEVTNETLVANYLPSPNESLAQLFNFANNAIAENPKPILKIKAKAGTIDDPQYGGFEIYYDNGQVKLSSPLNALYNYDLIAKTYYHYTVGITPEYILEQILTMPDEYGYYLFGETSAQAVIDNHLTDSFSNVKGAAFDTLSPNDESLSIDIKHQLTTAVVAGDTSIEMASTEGLPSTGSASINGDTFTWTSKDATHLYGIPATGEYALLAHSTNCYVKYTNTYAIGRVWYLSYSQISTALVSGNFTVPGANIQYIDRILGRIILDTAISSTATVTCDVDYNFSTIQATGIELNYISFRSREVANRLEAITKLKSYLAPNYIIRTSGDNKIWASYLSQKTIEDYTLQLETSINYLEDEDLYTRTIFYGKNKNPTNIMFKDGVSFITTGESYKASATQTTLVYDSEEGNFYVYRCGISGIGSIDVNTSVPIVYINGMPIDNTMHQIAGAPMQVTVRTRTETITRDGGACGETQVEVNTYYDYDVYFAHPNIEPSQPVYIYNNVGTLVYTIAPYTSGFNYGSGKWTIGGGVRNTVIESFSTASYSIFYASDALVIDYENALFKISKTLIPEHVNTLIQATFDYYTIMMSIAGISNLIDGRLDTQVQSIFYAEPPTGYNYAIVDLGQIYNIQAIDITAGYFKPDDIRKFDVDMRFTMEYSLDNINYYAISDKTNAFDLQTAESISFEEDDLGVGFRARYVKLIIENLKKSEYGITKNSATGAVIQEGVWVVSLTEVAAYDDIILKGEGYLIPTTQLTTPININSGDSSGTYPTTIDVVSTAGFDEPASGTDVKTAYIEEDTFTYTGLTATSFTGVEGLSTSHAANARVHAEIAGDASIYDDKGLLPKLHDRVYKNVNIKDGVYYDQTMLNRLARAWLSEFVKNHDKINIELLFAPYLSVGDTVKVIDSFKGINDNFFVESISQQGNMFSVVLARYE